jgi:hypothetical protein
MPFNGSGQFNRIFSWVADKAAGLDISSSRMDTDTDDITSSGFGNCITRDGQGQPTANLPMAGFRHTSVGNGVARSDYSAIGQTQDALLNWTIAGGTSDAITATYTPALTALNDGQLCFFRATAANTTTTPTFSPNGLGPNTITEQGGAPLTPGDIPGNLAEMILRYNSANTRWELLNPAALGTPTSGHVAFTLATTAPSGWLMFDDTTMGDASSGANHASNANLAVFTLLFNGVSDTNAPLLTSTGAATTRAAQGTAAAAWAANCRMSLPKTLGRALGVAGAGAGLTSQALGGAVGANSVNIAQSGLPNVAPSFAGATGAVNVTASTNVLAGQSSPGVPNTGGNVTGVSSATASNPVLTSSGSFTPSGTISSINGGQAQTATSIMSPQTFFNAIVKL